MPASTSAGEYADARVADYVYVMPLMSRQVLTVGSRLPAESVACACRLSSRDEMKQHDARYSYEPLRWSEAEHAKAEIDFPSQNAAQDYQRHTSRSERDGLLRSAILKIYARRDILRKFVNFRPVPLIIRCKSRPFARWLMGFPWRWARRVRPRQATAISTQLRMSNVTRSK